MSKAKFVFIMALILTISPTFFTVMPRVEAWAFPVVTKFEITSMVEDRLGTQIMVNFEKLRDCEFVGMAWYRGIQSGVFTRSFINFQRHDDDDTDASRAVGKQLAGPWLIGVPPEALAEESFAIVTHSCHPFWVTKTKVYP